MNEELDKLGWTGAELARRAKGDARKIQVAQRLRAETAVTLKRIAAELHMGTGTHVANRLKKRMARMPQTNNPNSDLCKYTGLTRFCGRSMLRRFQLQGQTLESEEVSDRLLLTY